MAAPRCAIGQITIPQTVMSELSAPEAPNLVRTWIGTPPDWLKIQSVSHPRDAIVNLLEQERTYTILLADRALRSVGFPERAAIELHADLLLLDDMKARRITTDRGLVITGILGIIDRAATMKLRPTCCRSKPSKHIFLGI